MPEILRYQPGSFCWTELLTADFENARDFYSTLFGWTSDKISGGAGERVSSMQIAGKEVASLKEHRNGVSQGISASWLCYVSVLDAAATATHALQLGGELLGAIAGHSEDGRMALIRDPLGATLGLWQPGSRIGARLGLEPNTVCWTELLSRHPVTSAGFYSALFGWTVREEGGYMEYLLSGASQAGMVLAGETQSAADSQWGVYFRVNDCDATVSKALDHGGLVLIPPTDIAGVGRLSRLRDPSGADFSVIRLGED